jgi:hypothetical protein
MYINYKLKGEGRSCLAKIVKAGFQSSLLFSQGVRIL